ncbi:MAG: hypothetical protein ACM3SS_07110 [Rhodospirillaceae bacterium]
MGDTVDDCQRDEPGQWKFRRKKDGSWHWRQTSLDGMTQVSAAGHRMLWDCMVDAMRHGYVPPTQADDDGAPAAA